jgi:hypothetical protein
MSKTTYKVGRRADDGKFCTIKYANEHRRTTVIETIRRK